MYRVRSSVHYNSGKIWATVENGGSISAAKAAIKSKSLESGISKLENSAKGDCQQIPVKSKPKMMHPSKDAVSTEKDVSKSAGDLAVVKKASSEKKGSKKKLKKLVKYSEQVGFLWLFCL